MSHTTVLIVGAGPSGLMMACELARFDIPFRIIDQKAERTLTSNAAGVQTRTLELLNHIGLLPAFIRRGIACSDLTVKSGNVTLDINFDHLTSLYHYILLLPQSDTEEIFIHHLHEQHHHVERAMTLMDLKEENKRYHVTIKNSAGKLENINCEYIIACDGAHSIIREKMGMPFLGNDIDEQFVVADGVTDKAPDNNRIHAYINDGKILAVFPIDINTYRLVANPEHKQPLTENDIKEIVATRSRNEFNLANAHWISPFWIHSKIVNKMRVGNIFLVGDAAHIHSPIGAQGMNTGIQDAYNLAWKLALVVHERAKPTLLDSYQAERYPIVKDIVEKTEWMTKVLLSKNVMTNVIRNIVLRIVSCSRYIRDKMCMRVTQLAIHYSNSPIINYQAIAKSPAPGTLAPDVQITSTNRLHDHCKNNHHNILLFTGTHPTSATITALQKLQNKITKHYPEIACSLLITNDAAQIANHVIYDVDNQIHQRYGVDTCAVFIIRPDQYIGASSKTCTWDTIHAYFCQLGIKP